MCAQCSLHVWAMRLQLDVGRVASERLEVVADGDQLGRIEGQGALVAEPGEAAGIEAAHGDRLHAAGGVVAGVEVGIGEGVGPVLDDRVGDQATQEHVGIRERRARWQLDAPSRGGGVHGHAELGGGTDHGLGGAVGHAGVQGDLGVRPVSCRGRIP